MPNNSNDTIYALTTPIGGKGGGVAVLRVSGALAKFSIESLTQKPPPPPRYMELCEFSYKTDVIDHGLVVFFATPNSWTGEDVAEFHIHGGVAISAAMMRAFAELGLRPANAGEFSKRAFLNGKADLNELEGLADLVAAETEAQRKQALRQMAGWASRIYEGWRKNLLATLAEAEALLDFSEDVKSENNENVTLTLINKTKQEIAEQLKIASCGERLREGIHIALIGGTNAGKSTLFNLLVKRQAAIVSPQAGTTRDVLEVAFDLSGYPIIISDSAGLRQSTESIEAEGIRRAEIKASEADLRLIILAPDIPDDENQRALSHYCQGDIVIVNKMDVSKYDFKADINLSLINPDENFEHLLNKLTKRVSILCGSGHSPLITRQRHHQALTDCHNALNRALENPAPELLAEDIRFALTSLGRITGKTGVEDMLDALFAEFCIGK